MDPGVRRRLLGLTVALIVVLPLSVIAARWQWSRHLERDALNAAVLAAEATAPVPWQQVPADDTSAWKQVTATGTWDPQRQLLIRRQVVDGRVGFTVMTPFRTEAGPALCVLRGWVPSAETPIPSPPTGTSVITLRVRPVAGTGPMGASDLPIGQVNRVEPSLACDPNAPRLLFELLDPVPTGLEALPWPELTSGPHLSYFVQWILIGCTGVIVYVRVFRNEVRLARRRDEDEPS